MIAIDLGSERETEYGTETKLICRWEEENNTKHRWCYCSGKCYYAVEIEITPMEKIHWYSISIKVDAETGEVLNDKQIKQHNYVKIQTTNQKTVNPGGTTGRIEWTTTYRRSGQLSLWENAS